MGISISNLNASITHNNVPFSPPSNMFISGKSTLTVTFTGKWSSASGIKSVVGAIFGPSGVIKFTKSNTTSTSGNKNYSFSVTFDSAPPYQPFPIYAEFFTSKSTSSSYETLDDNSINYIAQVLGSYRYEVWNPPIIQSYNVYRATAGGSQSDTGTYIRYSFAASITNNDYTHGSFYLRYRETSSPTWTTISLGSGISSINVSDVALSGTFPVNNSYVFEFVASDGYVQSVAQAQVFTASALFHINASKNGLAIGKYSEGPGFDVNWNSRFRGDVQFDQAPSYLTPVAAREALGIYTGRSVFTGVGSGTQYITVPFGKTLPSVPSAVIASIGVSGSMTSTYQTVDTTYAYTDHDFRIKCNNGSSLNTVWVDWIAIL